MLLASFTPGTALTRPKRALNVRGGGGARALNVRGGGGASHLSDVALFGGAGLLLIDGALDYMYPEKALTASKAGRIPYIGRGKDSDGLVACRHDGVWRVVLAALLLADPDTVHARAHFFNAAAALAQAPGVETFGVTKTPLLAWVGVSALLGLGATAGLVPNWVAPAIYVANGLMYYVDPDALVRLYFPDWRVPKSRIGFWATRNNGATFLVATVYLAALTPLAPGDGRGALDAFGAAMVALALSMLRFALADPKALGFSNVSRVGVVAFPAALAVAALV